MNQHQQQHSIHINKKNESCGKLIGEFDTKCTEKSIVELESINNFESLSLSEDSALKIPGI